jgi:hypothetical protein
MTCGSLRLPLECPLQTLSVGTERGSCKHHCNAGPSGAQSATHDDPFAGAPADDPFAGPAAARDPFAGVFSDVRWLQRVLLHEYAVPCASCKQLLDNVK